jgi:hypothetical protein
MKRFRTDLLCLLLLPVVMATGQWGLGAYICVGVDGHVGAKFDSDGKCSVRSAGHCGAETSCFNDQAICGHADACGACYDVPIGAGVGLRDFSPRRLSERNGRVTTDAWYASKPYRWARSALYSRSLNANDPGIDPHLCDLRTVVILT